MKKIFVGLALGLFPLLSQAMSFTMRCSALAGEGADMVRTELFVKENTGHLASLYTFVFSQTVVATGESLGFSNHGFVERTLFQNKPTQNFSNEVVSIYQLFGQSVGYSDFKNQFHFTFGQNACQKNEGPTFPTLDGTYDVDMKIGDRHIQDRMVLYGVNGPIRINFFDGEIGGVIIVPEVFSAPIQGSGYCSLWASRCVFKFEITARENGKEFRVFYEATLTENLFNLALGNSQSVTLAGVAKLENGEVLGTYTAMKRLKD